MSVMAELQSARQQQGLSLHDLARTTHVREIVLRALERGDPDLLSPLDDIKVYLRAYARQLGLDPKDVTTRYLAQLGA